MLLFACALLTRDKHIQKSALGIKTYMCVTTAVNRSIVKQVILSLIVNINFYWYGICLKVDNTSTSLIESKESMT